MFAALPANFAEAPFGGGLSRPTAMEFAPDGRLFVTEQGINGVGKIRIIKDGALLDAPAVSINVDSRGERGVLGLTFDPAFQNNHFIYVYYTTPQNGVHNRVSRFTLAGDKVAPASEKLLLDLDPLSDRLYHNGGSLHFGPDRKLYIAVGDNFDAGNSQSMTTLKGKMLRVNADGSVPADNPFYASTSGSLRAIWALGLRNPYTFAFQPSTGRLFINDVGQDRTEEINEGVAGANYGWPWVEGLRLDRPVPASYRDPIYTYSHENGAARAIVGGVFYEPANRQFPEAYAGRYFFGDHAGHFINTLDPRLATATGFAKDTGNLVDLDVGPDGALYYLQYGASSELGSGRIHRVRYTASRAPAISEQPASQVVSVGQPFKFSVSASGATPFRYQWQRNGVDIAGATSATFTRSAASKGDGGSYRVIVSNDQGSVISKIALLTVTANQAPVAIITSPQSGALYRGGETITFSGTGIDPESGSLSASAFTWSVDLHHLNHNHPLVAPSGGIRSGSFVIPAIGETSDQVFYRLHLTVRDPAGLTHSVHRDIRPQKSKLTVTTNVAGLSVLIDGQPAAAPFVDTGVVGIRRVLEAPATQTLNGKTFDFVSWSDGGAARHTISTPAADKTYTAVYRARSTQQPGGGLFATYFNNRDFTSPVFSTMDRTIDFDWGRGSPDSRIGADSFSVRWLGQIEPQFNEKYTFTASTDDGVRLWIDGRLIINQFARGGTFSRNITLEAGRKYSLRMDYFEATGNARARLQWSSPSLARQVVPANRLFQPAPAPTPAQASSVALASDSVVLAPLPRDAGMSAPIFAHREDDETGM